MIAAGGFVEVGNVDGVPIRKEDGTTSRVLVKMLEGFAGNIHEVYGGGNALTAGYARLGHEAHRALRRLVLSGADMLDATAGKRYNAERMRYVEFHTEAQAVLRAVEIFDALLGLKVFVDDVREVCR